MKISKLARHRAPEPHRKPEGSSPFPLPIGWGEGGRRPGEGFRISMRKISSVIFLLLALAFLSACRTPDPVPTRTNVFAPPEVMELSYLHEVVRYLYRWQLDESEVEHLLGQKRFIFWVRSIEIALDPGDHSQFAEILLPQLDVSVLVKKADYTVEESGVAVKAENFKIARITRGLVPKREPKDCEVVSVDTQEMCDYLFRTRYNHDYPDAALLAHFREAIHAQAVKEGIVDEDAPVRGEEIVHVAPLSPVANESWIFWEAGRRLLYITSDVDLKNPALWSHQQVSVRIFDLDDQVVVSHEEAPGSNRFLTRYQVSRAMFNCIVLGQRMVVPP